MVPREHGADLPYLVDLRMLAVALEIDSLFNSGAPKNMVTTPDSLLETEAKQEGGQIRKINAGIGGSQQDPVEQLTMFRHPAILP